ncbi:uncharacterized protein LOC143224811 isoform X2 [Tachypleus tridentatus]|uniref:uncharacterized protein LOC143224811 isoform X2 n=1 Tax=Tachypleus tridentatus TaxID=6853 RepID=UPI003FD306EA
MRSVVKRTVSQMRTITATHVNARMEKCSIKIRKSVKIHQIHAHLILAKMAEFVLSLRTLILSVSVRMDTVTKLAAKKDLCKYEVAGKIGNEECGEANCEPNEDDNSYSCECPDGKVFDKDQKICKDPPDPCTPNPCKNGGICSVVENINFKCKCEDGYGDETCSEKDLCKYEVAGKIGNEECGEANCEPNEDDNSYSCECPDGKVFDKDQKICKDPPDPCTPNPCKNGGICSVVENINFKCKCEDGYGDETCSEKDLCKYEVAGKIGNEECGEANCEPNEDDNSYSCECPDGKVFDKDQKICKDPPDPCTPNPCKNGGICSVVENINFKCKCEDGYGDETCSEKDFCKYEVAGKIGNEECGEANCEPNEDDNSYSCECPDGKVFDKDQKICKDPPDPCTPNPCKNGGICSVVENINFKCKCEDGYGDETCSEKDLCKYEVAGKIGNEECGEASCEPNEDDNSYSCECPDGKVFDKDQKICKDPPDPCTPNPCKNGGICSVVENINFKCKCEDGYGDETCSEKDLCKYEVAGKIGNEECGEANCEPNEDDNSFSCECPDGKVFDKEQKICKDPPDPCNPNPCENGGTCIPGSDEKDYSCECLTGFGNKTCSEVDFCKYPENGNNGIKACGQAKCNTVDDLQTFVCECDEPEYFDYYRATCTDKLDPCKLKLCPERRECKITEDTPTCECKGDYTEENDECKPKNFCEERTCDENEVCVEGPADHPRKTRCICKTGYVRIGSKCTSICVVNNPCKAFENCVLEDDSEDNKNGYSCTCEDPFTEKDGKCEVKEENECDVDCGDGGACVKSGDNNICRCKSGYIAEEKEGNQSCVHYCRSQAWNEDNKDKILCPGDCEPTETGFQCVCEGHYELDQESGSCKIKPLCDEDNEGYRNCSEKNAQCEINVDEELGYECKCPEGTEVNDGKCVSLCDIARYKDKCSKEYKDCIVDVEKNEAMCVCKPSFFTDADGNCKAATSTYKGTFTVIEKLTSSSVAFTESIDSTTSRVRREIEESLKSLFGQTFTDVYISDRSEKKDGQADYEIFIHFNSKEAPITRLSVEGVCKSANTSSGICIIPPSLVVASESIENFNSLSEYKRCDANNKPNFCPTPSSCSDENGQVKCRCYKGYQNVWSTKIADIAEIDHCIDIDECAKKSHDCPSDSTDCMNEEGNYTCVCKSGYKLPKHKTDPRQGCIGNCEDDPCENGKCIREDNGFFCNCEKGYIGRLCKEENKALKSAQTNTVVVGVVLGVVLLLILVISGVVIFRMKKTDSRGMFKE